MAHPLTAVRRAVSLALVAVLLALMAVVLMPSAQACGCGGFVSDEHSEVAVEAETAAISWDGQHERIVLSMAALSDAAEAALLLPTPAPAQVALAEEGVFAELEQIIAPQVQVQYRWWPDMRPSPDGDGDDGAPVGTVQVLETVDLGPLEATVLSAGDGAELAQWLDDHGYVMDDALAETVRPYVAEGWYYVAVRLTAETESLSGELPALDIEFASSAIIYPMRMSAAATQAQSVRTYVFADQRVARTDPTGQSVDVQLRYAGAPETAEIANGTVSELLQAGGYLTVMDQSFGSPSQQIVSDFVFERSSNGGDYRETIIEERMREILGLPAGPVLVAIGLVVLLAVGLARPWRLLGRTGVVAGER